MIRTKRPPHPQPLSPEAGARGAIRPAFSLVELLVAMALIVFIMSILSVAFAAGSKAFRDLKAAGDNAERLRGAIIILRSDLGNPHFDGKRKLSDPSFWRYGPGPLDYGPPPEGFFRIYQDQQERATWPGLPPNQVNEYTTVRSALHFTTRLPGKGPGEMFSSVLTNTGSQLVAGTTFGGQEGREQRFQDGINPVYRSQWAEVAWWMTPAVDAVGQQEFTKVDGPQANVVAQPLYVLRRRQVLLFSGSGLGTQGDIEVPPGDVNDEISIRPGANNNVRVNKPRDVTIPAFRWNMERVGNQGLGDPAYAGWPVGFARQFPVIPAPAPAPPSQQPPLPPNMYPAGFPVANPAGRVEDVVLNNVLSVDVRLLLHGQQQDFVNLFDPAVQRFGVRQANTALMARNPAYRFSTTAAPQGPLVFDTWSRANIDGHDYESNWDAASNYAALPLYQDYQTFQRIRIRAIMVVIRIWDQKSLQSRQVTIVQDM